MLREQKQCEMGEMSICLYFSYYILAYYIHALFFVPEQTAALSMHQNPSGESDAIFPGEDTGWSMNQLMDAVLAAQGKHRMRSARRSNSLVVRFFVVAEKLKKMDWGRAKGLWDGFPGNPSVWEEGLW